MAESRKSYRAYSGNRYNLRSRVLNQIVRIEGLADTLGPLGDFLVTNFKGLLLGAFVLAAGILTVFSVLGMNGGATKAQNLPAIIMLIIAFLLITLNIILTNPVRGSQLIVSFKFLIKKLKAVKAGKQRLNIYEMYKEDESGGTVRTLYRGNFVYLSVFQVRGTVSPVSTPEQLEYLASLEHSALTTMTEDVVLTTVNSIEKISIKPALKPKNVTPAMQKLMERDYQITMDLPINQQLNTNIVIAADSPESLWTERESLQKTFQQGLVIGYTQLRNKKLKDYFMGIYGDYRE